MAIGFSYGSGSGGLPLGNAVNLFSNATGDLTGKVCPHNEDRKLAVFATGTHEFRLDYLFSPNGTDWYIGKQETAAVIVVDGGVAGYVRQAILDIPVGRQYLIQLFSLDNSLNYTYEFREYVSSQT